LALDPRLSTKCRSQAPAQTILESGTDSGNFRGVAIYRQGRETVLVSELQAGWYRYISRWRFHDDGTIRPRFGFSAVQNACVCNVHHHVYWRLDFDIGAAENNEVREFNSPPNGNGVLCRFGAANRTEIVP
jgi:Cu2+-containing amine oxidase